VEFHGLLSKGDLLYLYRPCVEDNLAEQPIFGTSSSSLEPSSGSWTNIRDVYRPAEHLEKETLSQKPHLRLRYHFLYGSSSAIIKVKHQCDGLPLPGHIRESEATPVTLQSLLSSDSPFSSSSIDVDSNLTKRTLSVLGRIVSTEGMVLSSQRCRSVPHSLTLVPSSALHGYSLTPPFPLVLIESRADRETLSLQDQTHPGVI
jgi:hypothetical protein